MHSLQTIVLEPLCVEGRLVTHCFWWPFREGQGFCCNPFLHLPARDNYCVVQVLGHDFYQTSRSYRREGKL